MKKIILVMFTIFFGMVIVFSSAASGGNESSATDGNRVVIRFAHNHSTEHPIHVVLKQMADELKTETDGRITMKIFPNAVLGSSTEMVEQLQKGALDMVKVSSAFLENFSDLYGIFSLPYLFRDKEHFIRVMRSDVMKEIYESSRDDGFIGVDFFDSGARSFYTVNTPIRTVDDVKGLKIRVMQSPVTIEAMQLLGVSPVPMAFSEVYTALQQGVVDGAENNVMALKNKKHGEVVKYYSFDEHSRIPDVVIARVDFLQGLSKDNRTLILQKLREASDREITLWSAATKEAKKEASSIQGVEFLYPDKAPFQEKVKPIVEKMKKQSPQKERLISAIENM